MEKRIWELDALRGICILGMVVFHLVFDLTELYGLVSWRLPRALEVIQRAGGTVFFLLSGICVTLGRHHLRRGAIVLGCGMLCTAVTWGLWRMGLFPGDTVIWFGVLHCLGCCMLLWSVFRRLMPQWLVLLGILFLGLGYGLEAAPAVSISLWIPLGLVPAGFASGDYFPLVPFLGYFLLGAATGKRLYFRPVSRFPGIRPPRFLCLAGRNSLWIYLLHQPVFNLLCLAISLLEGFL